jgi:hypothetical protein
MSSYINAASLFSITVCEKVTTLGTTPLGIKDKFSPHTPNIHVVAVVKGLERGTKIKGSWISVDAIQPPNYQINSEKYQVQKDGQAKVHFSISRPKNGWPLGNYKFDLYINNRFFASAPFSIVTEFKPKTSESFNLGPIQKDKKRAWTVLV